MLKYFLFILTAFPGKLLSRNTLTDDPCIPVVTIAESENNICAGTTVTIHSGVVNGGKNQAYKWKINGIDAGVAGPDYSSAGFHEGDVVTCEYSVQTPCGVDTTVVSNKLVIHVANDVTPLINIGNTDPLICEGEVTTFTATYFYGNDVPTFKWTVNDLPVGTNSPVFTTSTITNGAKIECILTVSSPFCPGFSKTVSSQLTIYVYPLVHPAIEIKPSQVNICRGESINFTAVANGGANPALVWQTNGVPNGVMGSSFTTSTLQEGDVVNCTVIVDQDSRCKSTDSAGSNKVVIHIHDYPEPSVTIDAPVFKTCPGDPLTFTATSQNGGVNQYFEWQVNGKSIPYNGSVFTYDQFMNGDKVSCNLSTDIPGCPLSARVSSDTEKVMVWDAPLISFSPPEPVIFAGEQAQLNASVTNNISSYEWKPPGALVQPQSLTPTTVPLFHDSLYSLSVIDVNSCKASKDVLVKVLHKVYLPNAFTPNGDGLNDEFRIPPGTSLDLQKFSVFDRWGNTVFTTADISKGWDGRYLGEEASEGVYVYTIKGKVNGKTMSIKGIVTLMR